MKRIKRKSKKILIPKKINSEIEKYPMVSCEWFDIVSDSSWSSFEQIKNSDLATCITKGHLLSQSKGITRIFGDYSLSEDKKKIETIGNTTLIPNSVIKEIKKIYTCNISINIHYPFMHKFIAFLLRSVIFYPFIAIFILILLMFL